MSEKPGKPDLDPIQKRVFEDVRNRPEELFTKSTSLFGSLAELVREWAVYSGWKEKTGKELNDPFMVRLYYRTSLVIGYANRRVGKDTNNYRNPNDVRFHEDLIPISSEIEEDWEQKHEDENWKKEMLSKIDERTDRYIKETSSGNQG